MSVSPARELALRILEQVMVTGRPVQAVLDGALRKNIYSVRDRSLSTELVYGVLRLQIRHDLIIDRFLQSPAKTPLILRLILHIGIYEILCLDRIPAYATVNAATDLAKKRLGIGLGRVVNGVLRSVVRSIDANRDVFSAVSLEKDAGFAASSGIPQWILDIWSLYGEDTMRKLADASVRVPWLCVRVNALKPGANELAERLASMPSACRVGLFGVMFAPHARPDNMDDLIRKGLISIQGAGSLRALDALGLFEPCGTVWDACAGRGGKTFALVERGVNVVIASDTSEKRLSGIVSEAERLGVRCPHIIRASATNPPFDPDTFFDTVLVDAPCSGLGTLARHPDLRLARKKEHLIGLTDTQKKILDAAWEKVRRGGRLAYITCTVNPDENERRVEAFMDTHKNASLLIRHTPEPDMTGADVMFGVLFGKE